MPGEHINPAPPDPSDTRSVPGLLDPTIFGPKNAYLFDRPTLPEIRPNYLPPNAEVVVDLGEHVSVEDFVGVEAGFDAADIFIPEVVMWTKDMRRDWQEMARGDDRVFAAELAKWGYGAGGNAVGHDFREKLIRTIHERGGGKTIAFIDAADGEIAVPDLGFGPGSTPDETLYNYAFRVAKTAYINAHREPRMVSNLGSTVSRIVASKRELKRKDPVLVLVTAGSDHASAYEHIQASPNIVDGQVQLNIRAPEGREGDYQREVLQAFTELRMPTRQQVVNATLWNALTIMPDMRLDPTEPFAPFPLQTRHSIMKLMAETEEAPDVTHAILTGNLTPKLAEVFTGHINEALKDVPNFEKEA